MKTHADIVANATLKHPWDLPDHIINTVFDIRKHASEMNLKGIVLAVRLLNAVVHDLANMAKSNIASLRVLIIHKTLLLRNEHFVHALVKGRTDIRGNAWSAVGYSQHSVFRMRDDSSTIYEWNCRTASSGLPMVFWGFRFISRKFTGKDRALPYRTSSETADKLEAASIPSLCDGRDIYSLSPIQLWMQTAHAALISKLNCCQVGRILLAAGSRAQNRARIGSRTTNANANGNIAVMTHLRQDSEKKSRCAKEMWWLKSAFVREPSNGSR